MGIARTINLVELNGDAPFSIKDFYVYYFHMLQNNVTYVNTLFNLALRSTKNIDISTQTWQLIK